MSAMGVSVKWMLVSAFCALTGYTDKAVRQKMSQGVWTEGLQYKKAPDGRITMNMEEYYNWVENGQKSRD